MTRKADKKPANPNSSLFVFGLDENGKPRGARFNEVREDIITAAINMGCWIVSPPPEEFLPHGMKLPTGRLYASGRAFIAPIKLLPQDAKGPVPFMLVLHGCAGLKDNDNAWAHHVADLLNPQGIGVLILDSFTTRYVDMSCGKPDLHWARRRAEDAYSALQYLVEKKLAKPSEVYIMGESNGGTTTLVAMTREMNYHKYRFAAGFPLTPACFSVTLKYGDYYNPTTMFAADNDDANLIRGVRR